MSLKQVIITVPVYRLPLTPDEKTSIRHLRHYLGGFDITIIAPESLHLAEPLLADLPVMRFDPAYFKGIAGYNQLMLSTEFYRRFQKYEYILIYQLDCLVFSSDLSAWCQKGWDYVGAPWFKNQGSDTSQGLWSVGNGGLSLRRVEGFLEVLRSKRLLRSPLELARSNPRFQNLPPLRPFALVAAALGYAIGYRNTVRSLIKHCRDNEDLFWSDEARLAVPSFKVAAPLEALPFAFESAPRYCFDLNGRRLPFGCHAWAKMDPDFWRPHLLPVGTKI